MSHIRTDKILGISRLRQKKKTNWQRLKEDPFKMAAYKSWRKEYNRRRKGEVVITPNYKKWRKSVGKEKEIGRSSVADIKIQYHKVIYEITDLLLSIFKIMRL